MNVLRTKERLVEAQRKVDLLKRRLDTVLEQYDRHDLDIDTRHTLILGLAQSVRATGNEIAALMKPNGED